MAKPNKQSVQFFVILWARPHELLTPSRGKAPPSAALRGAVVTLKRRSVWLGLPLDASRIHALQLFLSSYVCVTRGPIRRAPLAARSGPFPTVLAHGNNVFSNIIGWIVYTPVFQQVTILIASPIALLVALWGMSDVRALEQIGSIVVPSTPLGARVLSSSVRPTSLTHTTQNSRETLVRDARQGHARNNTQTQRARTTHNLQPR